MLDQKLTPDEKRALGIAVLTATVTALATGLVTWGYEEAKRLLAKKREHE